MPGSRPWSWDDVYVDADVPSTCSTAPTRRKYTHPGSTPAPADTGRAWRPRSLSSDTWARPSNQQQQQQAVLQQQQQVQQADGTSSAPWSWPEEQQLPTAPAAPRAHPSSMGRAVERAQPLHHHHHQQRQGPLRGVTRQISSDTGLRLSQLWGRLRCLLPKQHKQPQQPQAAHHHQQQQSLAAQPQRVTSQHSSPPGTVCSLASTLWRRSSTSLSAATLAATPPGLNATPPPAGPLAAAAAGAAAADTGHAAAGTGAGRAAAAARQPWSLEFLQDQLQQAAPSLIAVAVAVASIQLARGLRQLLQVTLVPVASHMRYSSAAVADAVTWDVTRLTRVTPSTSSSSSGSSGSSDVSSTAAATASSSDDHTWSARLLLVFCVAVLLAVAITARLCLHRQRRARRHPPSPAVLTPRQVSPMQPPVGAWPAPTVTAAAAAGGAAAGVGSIRESRSTLNSSTAVRWLTPGGLAAAWAPRSQQQQQQQQAAMGVTAAVPQVDVLEAPLVTAAARPTAGAWPWSLLLWPSRPSGPRAAPGDMQRSTPAAVAAPAAAAAAGAAAHQSPLLQQQGQALQPCRGPTQVSATTTTTTSSNRGGGHSSRRPLVVGWLRWLGFGAVGEPAPGAAPLDQVGTPGERAAAAAGAAGEPSVSAAPPQPTWPLPATQPPPHDHHHHHHQQQQQQQEQQGVAPPALFLCPLTHEVMVDPVVAQDGYTYERDMITRWQARSCRSPMTNQAMGRALLPNHALRSSIQEWALQQGLAERPGAAAVVQRGAGKWFYR